MSWSAASVLLRQWALCLLATTLWHHAAVLAQPSAFPPAPETSDRQLLLERLRDAQVQLTDLEQSIRALERRLGPAPDDQEPQHPPQVQARTAPPEPAIPVHWLWLGVLTIVILMVGITYSGRPARAQAPPAPEKDGLSEFQAHLGRLDLNLDPPPNATTPVCGADQRQP